MTAADPNFFICLLLGGAVLYGLMPAYGAFALSLAALWVLGKAPPLFFLLAGLWLGRWLLVDFALALIAAFGFGLGFGRATHPRYPRRRAWTDTELRRHDAEFRRGAPRALGRRPEDYNPWPGDEIDMG